MDFFAHQRQARRKTWTLVALFVAATAGLIAAVYGVAVLALTFVSTESASWWQPQVFGLASAGTLIVVGLGTLYRTAQLRSGGKAIAQLLGGRIVVPNSPEPTEKQLLNTVEEVAIASGVPVPAVYLLENEAGINAFAAGFSSNDAVVGVTRGTIEQLTRDELQGVVAHEFSHILHGDMRLNLRLIGFLHGILCVGLAGSILLRSLSFTRTHRRGKGEGNLMVPVVILGAGLWIVGSVGVLLARLIQAAVCRQREFLADASAVQFTRNPAGIAGALKKIGGYTQGARLRTAQATAMSHLFFGNARSSAMFTAFATHPPLAERIRRIEKAWVPEARAAGTAATTPELVAPGVLRLTPAAAVTSTGQPTSRDLLRSQAILEQLPLAVTAACREPFAARALVLAALVSKDATLRQAQLAEVGKRLGAATAHDVAVLVTEIRATDDELRLPLVEMALPALRQMSPGQHALLATTVTALVAADAKVSVFEQALLEVLQAALRSHFEPIPITRREPGTRTLAAAVHVVLSCLAHFGHQAPALAHAAFAHGQRLLSDLGGNAPLLAAEACGLAELHTALDHLSHASAGTKRQILRACAETIAHDGVLDPKETEMLRVIALAFGCPIPTLPT